MKILVTGAAGFIGSHVSEYLATRGDTVLGLDNFNNYYDPALKHMNVARVAARVALVAPGYRWNVLNLDIRQRDTMLNLFQDYRFDVVIHLAAMAGVRNAVKHPDLYMDVNLMGTLNLMDAARQTGVGNFVLASTSSVYGGTTILPFIETDPCDRPLQPYAASKRAAELLGHSYHHLYGLNVTALRFFTVYGPAGRPDLMASLLLDSVFNGREVPLYNNGDMYRDWTFIGDIVKGVVAAATTPLGFEVINLGRGEPVYLKRFIEIVEAQAGAKANLIPAPMHKADFLRNDADISKARQLLGYQPVVSVEQGVAELLKWHRHKDRNPFA